MTIRRTYLATKMGELAARHSHAGDFCFFTDIENLPRIFRSGHLLSRSRVIAADNLHLDCASADVLAKTPAWVHDHVRMYFAPLTPMLYQVEGIKRQQDEWPECPRPAYLVFQTSILRVTGARISDGNMGSKYSKFAEASEEYFDTLPFDDIYHRGALSKDPNAMAIYGFDPGVADKVRRRQAEILIPDELPLSHLREVVFRSDAERDLAVDDIGEHLNGASVRVDKSWFFAQSRGRPYLDTFIKGPGGTFSVANPREGDEFAQVHRRADGTVAGWLTTFTNSKWGTWAVLDVTEAGLSAPRRGRRRFFLRGHRVAEEDL